MCVRVCVCVYECVRYILRVQVAYHAVHATAKWASCCGGRTMVTCMLDNAANACCCVAACLLHTTLPFNHIAKASCEHRHREHRQLLRPASVPHHSSTCGHSRTKRKLSKRVVYMHHGKPKQNQQSYLDRRPVLHAKCPRIPCRIFASPSRAQNRRDNQHHCTSTAF